MKKLKLKLKSKLLVSILVFLITFILLSLVAYNRYDSFYFYFNILIISFFVALFVYLNLRNKIFEEKSFLFSMILVGFILLSLSIVFRQSGWPFNHEGLPFVNRTQIYAENLIQWNFIPIWSPSDIFGMGSPLPLFYHKLFYYLSSTLFLATNSMKTSIILSISIFLFVGSVGIFKCFRSINLDKISSFILALSFVFLNYTFTDWLIRGAMAEFSAFMLLPWIFLWCINFLKTQEIKIYIAALLFLLYTAHNAIALYAISLPVLSFLILLFSKKISFNKELFRKLGISILIFLCLMGIFLIPMYFMLKNYSPSSITSYDYSPQNQFQPILNYLFDYKYIWGENWQKTLVEFDLPLTTFCVFSFMYFIWKKRETLLKQIKSKTFYKNPILTFILITLIIFIFLQLKISSPLYTHIPFLSYIQFPWRLVAFISVILLLLTSFFITKFSLQKKFNIFITSIILISVILLSPIVHEIKYEWYPNNQMENIVSPNDLYGYGINLIGIGEYLPKINEKKEITQSIKYYADLKNQGFQIISGNCDINLIQPKIAEQIYRDYNVTCKNNSEVVFPFNFSGLENGIIRNNSIKLSSFRYDNDPRMRFNLPQGDYVFRIKFPTFFNILY